MLTELFKKVYNQFKMHFYNEVFKKWRGREVSLTTVETFCMEIIYALGKPTVSQFSKFCSLSSANAADKISKLVSKGYLNKVQSETDKRKFYLEPTQKYLDYYDLSDTYVDSVLNKVKDKFTKDEMQTFYKILKVLDQELESNNREKEGFT